MMQWSSLLSDSRSTDPKKTNSTQAFRSGFEVDFDRLIFSSPFRSLQDKTQVFPMPDHAFVHSRLTHSLEVSSVGRSLGKTIGQYVLDENRELTKSGITIHDFGAIIAAASLAHDIGNPPFGHSGETAISEFYQCNAVGKSFESHLSVEQWSDMINFEGNAQGFRLLTKHSNKGLRLTNATMAAFAKYPCQSLYPKRNKALKSQKKYGFFQSEKEVFRNLATILDLNKVDEYVWSRHPLVFLVEAADDICYNIIDLEDGCRLGFVAFDEVRQLFAEILGDGYQHEKLMRYRSLDEKLGILRALVISKLITDVSSLFKQKEALILSGSYDSALIEDIPSASVMKEIQNLSIDKIYRSDQVLEREMAGFKVIEGIMEAFGEALFSKYFDKNKFSKRQEHILNFFPETLTYELELGEQSVYYMLLALNDYVSGLTDSQALSIFRILNGISVTGKKVF